ncbi:MAG TPA: folate-binding protein [Rudaea sp.]|nr:folate-binding protein [Rudaea sp.]
MIALRGPDAIAFAHAQFSSDVRAQANGHWQFSAWLSPQGRVRAFFHLLRDDDEHLRLLLRGAHARDMATALQRFVFRSKVEILVLDEIGVFGCTDAQVVAEFCGDVAADSIITGGPPCTNLSISADPSRWLMMFDDASAQSAPTSHDADRNPWILADIRAGLIELAQALEDQFLPHWLGLTRLGAVSVTKGCYPGQEIMARLHFKGGNKRSLYLVEFQGDHAPMPGTQIVCSRQPQETAGAIIIAATTSAKQTIALATLSDDLHAMPLQIIGQDMSATGARTRFD